MVFMLLREITRVCTGDLNGDIWYSQSEDNHIGYLIYMCVCERERFFLKGMSLFLGKQPRWVW